MADKHDLLNKTADILVVDDTGASLRMLTEILTKAGYKTRPAEEPQFALESALAQPPSLILLDVKMPKMSGFEVCRRLKQEERTREVPVIFVSALDELQDRMKGFEIGGIDFISKPFQEAEILARVKTHLQLRNTQLHLEELVSQRTAELGILLKERSQALNSAEEQIRILVETAQVGIALSTFEGDLLAANPALLDMIGYTQAEALKLNVATLYADPSERALMLQQLEKENAVRDFGAKVKRKDGTHFFVSINVSLTKRAGQDILLVLIEDVTDKIQAEATLRESEQRSRALFQSMPLPSYYWQQIGENFVLIDCNDAADVFTHGSASKAIGSTLTAMYSDRPDIVEDISRCFTEKITIKREMAYSFTSTEQDKDLAVTYAFAPPDLVIVQTEDISDRRILETQLVEAAARAERDRLARDLHDSVTQGIYAASLIADTLPVIWEEDPEQGRRGLKQLEYFTKGALAEMRTLLLEMNPNALTDQELPILLRQLGDAMMARTKTLVTTTFVGDCEMPAEVKIALYRITQETLNNVAKHAQASHAIINLQDDGSQISLRIRDDGHGFDPQNSQSYGLGIGIMQDRVRDIGAELTITSQVSQGTEIYVQWGADGQSLS